MLIASIAVCLMLILYLTGGDATLARQFLRNLARRLF
jgi:hypothetical protein